MATIAALKATKVMKTASKAVKTVNKTVNKIGHKIDENRAVFQFGKAVSGIFGIPRGEKDDEVMKKLDEIHLDVKQGFHDVQRCLDELQLSQGINEKAYYLDFHYKRINEINAEATDPDRRDKMLEQLLLIGESVNKENDVLDNIREIKDLLLGEEPWGYHG